MYKGLNEGFVSVPPIRENLRPFIAYYYFHHTNSRDASNTYVYYPHYRTALTIYQNQDLKVQDGLCIYTPSDEPCSTVFYSRNLKKAIKVVQHGVVNKIAVVFNPLGINHFIKGKLSNYSNSTYATFTFFNGELAALCQSISPASTKEKAMALDNFFQSKLSGFTNPRLEKCLALLTERKSEIRVSEMAIELQTTRKTIYRDFQDHLCSSVEEYRAILKFRLALNHFYRAKNMNLTQLGYENSFYDQPNFIKHFKKITGYSPSTFFQNLSQLTDNDIYWTLN